MDLNICGGAYDVKAPISVQESINLYSEVEKQGSQSRLVLRRFPGLKLFSDLGGVIRGMECMDGVLYAVSDTTLYSIDSNGTSTAITGTIAGTGVVSMANDGINLVIVNGANGYVYDGSSLTQINDADFLPPSKVIFLDTYFIFLRSDTNQFFLSESGSATSFIATDRATAEAAPGNITSLISSNRSLILFQLDTIETWRNAGNSDFPFQRQEGTYQEQGSIGVNAPVDINGDVYYLGNDKIVYKMVGYQSIRISHHAIESFISKQSDDPIGMGLTYEGHYWYVLSFDAGTWVYDATTSNMMQQSEWFQLQSWDSDNWRVSLIKSAYGKILCGGRNGIIYDLTPDVFTENGEKQLKQRTTPYYHNERKPMTPSRIKLAFEQGVANSDVEDPQVMFSISKDWGRTFGNRRNRSLGQAGQYKQNAIWTRNGITRGDVFRWTVTDDVDVTFTGAYAEWGSGNG